MRTATVRDLRNHYASLLSWVSAGEEIVITQRGKPVARLVPENPQKPIKISWTDAPEITRDRRGEQILTAEESSPLINDAAGKW